jgi:membrane associated rhomboid family serine protease
MGAYFVLFPRSRVHTLIPFFPFFFEVFEVPTIFLLGFWFLMQLVSAGAIAITASTNGGGVAFMAHVAGFLFGVVGVFVFKNRKLDAEYWA